MPFVPAKISRSRARFSRSFIAVLFHAVSDQLNDVTGGIVRIGAALPFVTLLCGAAIPVRNRSEEHTSELQSRRDLVCRLLLEKKKKKTNINEDINQKYTQLAIISTLHPQATPLISNTPTSRHRSPYTYHTLYTRHLLLS